MAHRVRPRAPAADRGPGPRLGSLPDEARERVRALQRAYVDVWAAQLRRHDATLSPEASRTRAHASFGLLNSTPHSGRLPDPQMHDVLRDMAHGALGLS